jgi:hypothetical protein
MDKFTMELVWHNCKTHQPKETVNEKLVMTDGYKVFEAFWYRPDGFMIRVKDRWHGVYEDLNKWYWADIRQTVRGDSRFKGLIKDDLVESCNEYIAKLTDNYKNFLIDALLG